jgi:hypothetical protein
MQRMMFKFRAAASISRVRAPAWCHTASDRCHSRSRRSSPAGAARFECVFEKSVVEVGRLLGKGREGAIRERRIKQNIHMQMHQRSCRERDCRPCFLDGELASDWNFSCRAGAAGGFGSALAFTLPASDAEFAVANPRYCCCCCSTCAPRLPCLNAAMRNTE